jgi:hypothetical protein
MDNPYGKNYTLVQISINILQLCLSNTYPSHFPLQVACSKESVIIIVISLLQKKNFHWTLDVTCML